MSAIVRVAVGICRESEKFLMGRRHDSDGIFGGYWEFPGGKFEQGETALQALRREFSEELNAEIESANFLGTRHWSYPHRQVELHLFLVRLKTKVLAKNSHSDLAWVTKEQALLLKVLPANVEIIQSL